MQLSIMAAMGQNRVIGNQGRLPWPPMPADWTHLHKVCQGKKMIMGRKSYDTPDRISSATGNVVISRQPNYPLEKGFIQANSLPQALAMLHDEVEVFVMGGEEIYRQALPYVEVIHLTIVQGVFEGDAFFPEFEDLFTLVSEAHFPADSDNPFAYSFLVYMRAT
ncbi:MAG: dihydrofolate reductase [Spirosomataceae bacterium]